MTVGLRDRERAALDRAVALAARGLGGTSPNPAVGCVVLDAAGDVVGEGWHARAGGPHAEVVALREAGERARGGTAVVTLEPCDHTGRTGPCSRALLAAGVARVVVGVPDPTPQAAGGAGTLAAAGVDVVRAGPEDARGALRVNESWLLAQRLGRPHVTWKYAATLDGRSAAADGTSRWITSSASRADAHLLRARSDAVVVGVGTVLADDPSLTVRDLPPTGDDVADAELATRAPLRVVLDADGRTPPGAAVRRGSGPGAGECLVLTAGDVGRGPRGGVDLHGALAALHARGVRSVMLEGGPRLAGAFLDAGLVDRVRGYLAPALLGQGTAAVVTAVTGASMDAVARLEVDDVVRVGPDLRVDLVPVR
ncbi:bifunctional diaminohydroxyphosphoribosylaminopyrimidine deaminase/5-amino-6-(5-phosphoribosylamino)uracil reductase RibD [uncultured Pseudokineococcus sp.]|uniref:bifunctional diaminohydroxyphosphoribosylaminopyrimidine deaminase/5-amino-6-(5-phosphoribosylamino)uracil reductase RibD n=1 Tax=uncultured Pseudokineococcus sp. TaxID=1642928 RepID=UPI002609B8E8|nr:bifunctional diaminohydroxyphosphoribosylaminopyrimidine deaminase/5-amino-6-(5-phosphoribosylamino)uracil reductase RibD [uncultured Pseudokineococcus sp.]